jgi:Family of unknown function (DUF6262)
MTNASPPATAMADGRRADSARRRQRVIAAINRAVTDGTEISVSAIARAAAADRTFLYRHRDLLGKIHATQASPPASNGAGPAVTRAALQADLLAAHERALRLHARIQQLEKRLSEVLGEQAWRESGLGAPGIDTLSQKITHLEQQAIDLRLQVEERDSELFAARAANRELMAQLNATARHRRHGNPCRCGRRGLAHHSHAGLTWLWDGSRAVSPPGGGPARRRTRPASRRRRGRSRSRTTEGPSNGWPECK